MVARVGRELLQRQRVLREARAAVADAGAQEVRAEAMVEPHSFSDAGDVGADELADVRDLVDEADPRHEERVGGELDHLGRGDVGAHDRRSERLVERGDRVPVRVGEGADRDPVRVHEVLDRRALGEELGVRDVADVSKSAHVELVAHLLAGSDGDGALHDEQRALLEGGQLVEHVPDGGEVGVAGVRGRRPHADERDACVREHVLDGEREAHPLPVLRDQLLELGLEDRHAAGLEVGDSLRHDVAHDDRMAELGEAGCGDETDPARAENPYGFLDARAHRRYSSS